MKYFATYASGFREIVVKYLSETISDAQIKQVFDGAILFSTQKCFSDMHLRCFNNIFQVLDTMKLPDIENDQVERHLSKLINKFPYHEMGSYHANKRKKSFRIVTLSRSCLISVNKTKKIKLEQLIKKQTGLEVKRDKADIEFWIIYRNEGVSLFLKRLTTHKTYSKILKKGALHPEIAFMLVWISHPQKNSIVLDPFCGTGSIAIQCAKYFKSKMIYSCDNDNDKIIDLVNYLKKSEHKGISNKIICTNADFTKLESMFDKESVDIIITDPPWGLYNESEYKENDVNDLYNEFMKIFATILKQNATLVILTACKRLMKDIIKESKIFSIKNEYQVLISGKQSGIFVINKIG